MTIDGQSEATYCELRVEPELLDDARILAAGEAAVVFRLGTSHNHLPTREDESRCLRLTNAHDDGSETLRVVLGVTRVQSDRLQVEASAEVDGRHDVLECGHYARRDLPILAGRRSRNAVRVVRLLNVLLRGRWGQVRVLGVRQGARSHELGEHVRTD
jgi:hypothetical protein